MIKFVKQRRQDDCGVACAAMLAGVTYEKALKEIFPNSYKALDTPRWTTNEEMIVGLRRLGLPAIDGIAYLINKRLGKMLTRPPYTTICRQDWPVIFKYEPVEWHWLVAEIDGDTARWWDPAREPEPLYYFSFSSDRRPTRYIRIEGRSS